MASESRASNRGPARVEPYSVVSPVNGRVIAQVPLWDAEAIAAQLGATTAASSRQPLDEALVLAFLRRFEAEVAASREQLVESTVLETGFIVEHSREIVDGAIEFLRDFERHTRAQSPRKSRAPHSYSSASDREMAITHRPYRWVGAMVPQNASFTLAITIIASALYAGARVLVRPSLQCGATAALLAEMVERSRPPDGSVLIVNSLAKDFLSACHASDEVELIHYIGSNQYALSVFVESFAAKKMCLLDGQGNGMLYVDRGFPVEEAVRLIVSGATRYNGETCTSVNGVLVNERDYPAVRDGLVEAFGRLRVGDPNAPDTEIGPLFSRPQTEELVAALRGNDSHRVLCGGTAFGAYLAPAVVEGVRPDDRLVREGVFGPAVWIQPVREEELPRWLRANTFPLSDTILTERREQVSAFALNSRAARICVNVDPAVESMFEPWGGYPPSGLNPVSIWIDKYRRAYQLDGPSRMLRQPRVARGRRRA